MSGQIECYAPSLIPSGMIRLQIEPIRNPILRNLAMLHNIGIGNTSLQNTRSAYNKGSHTKTIHTKGGNGGGCFLTTACVNARGLQDDCLELETLRAFRERVLMPSAGGRAMIKEYEHIAPLIVESIDSSEMPRSIWDGVYSDVQKAASLVIAGSYNQAFEHYKGMTSKLKAKYL